MPNRCMALIRFRCVDEAEMFLEEYNGKAFWAMLEVCRSVSTREYFELTICSKDELCQVVRVASIEVRTSATPPYTFPFSSEEEVAPPASSSSAVELPTCVVCLERMDANITGLITIPCSHTFHCQ